MVGFPGETEEDFFYLYEFVNRAKFEKMGAFKYSKEDGTPAKIDEKLPLKFIEFNKENKKIFVSHSRTYEDLNKPAEEEKKKKESKAKKAKPADKMEKTTIGDVTNLAALKEELLQQEKNQ